MHASTYKFLWLNAFCLLLAGCSTGPLTDLAALNPYYRSQWQEDEQAGPTFHTQLAELRAIRQNPSGLGPQDQARIVPLLSNILATSPNTVLRTEAALTLAEFNSPEVIPALQSAAIDEMVDVRIAACRALGRLGTPAALEVLSEAIRSDADLDVRIAAAAELARFPNQQEAIQALGVALADKDPALQFRAVNSLREITGRDYGNSVTAWRDFVAGRTPTPPPQPSLAERLSPLNWF